MIVRENIEKNLIEFKHNSMVIETKEEIVHIKCNSIK